MLVKTIRTSSESCNSKCQTQQSRRSNHMKSVALFKALNSERVRERNARLSRRNAQRCAVVALSTLLLALSARGLNAQVGDNSPGGHSGIFNGQIQTGCSYDPYTGNATRSITDIAVSAAVGQYPLALVRTYNSRSGLGGGFGIQWT